jgi:hypothetical protein
MKYLIVLLLFCGVPSMADAAFRIYLVPTVVVVSNGRNSTVPKYFTDGTISSSAGWSSVYFGQEGWVFVGVDLSPADDATIVAKPDGFALPFDLTQTLTAGQVTAVQAKLESVNIPAQWVTTSLTWKQVLRTTLSMCQILQRFGGRNTTRFFSVATLNGTVGSLPVGVRNDLSAAAVDLGLDTSSITGATTIRGALRIFGEQMRDSNRKLDDDLLQVSCHHAKGQAARSMDMLAMRVGKQRSGATR